MDISELKQLHQRFFGPLVYEIQSKGFLSAQSFKDARFVAGNTTRAFRRKLSGLEDGVDTTISAKIRKSLTDEDSQRLMKEILATKSLKNRLDLKKELAVKKLSWLRGPKDSKQQHFKRVKVIDLALKEFVFCLDGGVERFKHTDTALDKMTLTPFVGQTIGGVCIRKQASMGDIASDKQYLAIQSEIRKSFPDGWTYDFVAWNLLRLLSKIDYANPLT